MQAFFAPICEIFFFFSEGVFPSPMRSFRLREAALPLRKNFGKLFLFLQQNAAQGVSLMNPHERYSR